MRRRGGRITAPLTQEYGLRRPVCNGCLLAAWSSPAVANDSVSLLRGAERVHAEGPAALLDLPHHPLPVALYALAGRFMDAELAAVILGAVAGGLALWPLHSLARRACGRHAATAACILYVVLPKAVGVASVPLAEGLFLPQRNPMSC